MKKGQVYEGIVTRVDFPNKAYVEADGEVAIVKNALPGQKIEFIVSKVRKGKAEGRLKSVIEKSPMEVGPTCSHFGVCGGCTYLSLNYDDQVKLKEEQVYKLLDGVIGEKSVNGPWTWEGIKKSPVYHGYRNKMEFSFGDEFKDGPMALGMHKRGSFYDIVTVDDCMIVDSDYRIILRATLDYFTEKNVPFLHRMSHEGFLRHLLVRKASKTGEILVALVTTSRMDEEVRNELVEGYRDMLLELVRDGRVAGSFAGILHIINDSLADVVRADVTNVLYGREYFVEELLGLKFKVSTFSFFQTNSYSAEVLYSTAREYIGNLGGSDKVVFDLYSGTGTIAQLMAPACKKVVGVEIVEEAVEAAKKNALENGLDNCEFIAGDVLKVLDDVEDKPDFIILDPPRDGVHPKALQKIIGYGVDRILYISCKPTSLTRDLETFLENGYRVERACCVDQFPWTANVETVCLLSKLHEAKHHVNVKLDMDELDLTSA
nr:23S rRNA (uracil(1939)-C(5))-methyltransferase RlmD [Acetatifactor sp.]